VIVYVDSSALLRVVFRQGGALDELRKCDLLIASELLVVESLRTVDRLRAINALSTENAAARRAVVGEWLESIDLVTLQRPILARASEPFPTPLGTLDALHLATALVWRERTGEPLVMATHDDALAIAARSFGFEVLGA
jgi:predicted nucleic acid-binding protein